MLTEFDRAFINPFYWSSYDSNTTVQPGPLVAASAALATTLYALAFDGAPPQQLQAGAP